MITEVIHVTGGGQVSYHANGTKTNRSEFYCKSSDPKPNEGVENADILYEMDTGKCYLYDADAHTWLEQ